MRIFTLILFFTVVFNMNGFSQLKFPVEFRVEKQSMSTPMSVIEEMFFGSPYYSKPVNVKFDGSLLNIVYDNGVAFTKKELTRVDYVAEYEDNALSMETYFYTDNNNVSDTLLFVVDYNVGYVQMILPTKNSKKENIGYTSYRKFVKDNELALK